MMALDEKLRFSGTSVGPNLFCAWMHKKFGIIYQKVDAIFQSIWTKEPERCHQNQMAKNNVHY